MWGNCVSWWLKFDTIGSSHCGHPASDLSTFLLVGNIIKFRVTLTAPVKENYFPLIGFLKDNGGVHP